MSTRHRAVFVFLIIFAFILTNYGEVEAFSVRNVQVTGEVIKIERHPPFQLTNVKLGEFMPQQLFAIATITLRTEKGDITLPIARDAFLGFGSIEIGDIVSAIYVEAIGDWTKTIILSRFISVIERIRNAAEIEKIKVRIASYLLSEKVRIASEQAKAQIPKAITFAKLGMTKEAIDLYLSIPEEVWTPDNIPLWNDRNDLLQALKPYVQQHKNNAKSLEAKGQYKEALNEYAEGLKVADDTEAKEIRKAALEIVRRNPALSEITEDARKYAVRGDVLLKEGNFEQAAKEYRKAINISPFTASLYFNTALIYGGHKNYPEAIRYMKIYLQLAPDAPNARAAQDEIYKWELQIEKAGKAGGQ